MNIIGNVNPNPGKEDSIIRMYLSSPSKPD
jgi:hypothetical protein